MDEACSNTVRKDSIEGLFNLLTIQECLWSSNLHAKANVPSTSQEITDLFCNS